MHTSKCEHEGLGKQWGETETTSLNSLVGYFWTNLLDLPSPEKLFLVKGRRKGIGFKLICEEYAFWYPAKVLFP